MLHRECERAIQEYRGDDPLAPWLAYIRWTQETYPDDADALTPILNKCTKLFKGDERYRNSVKYLKLWIFYADMCEHPEEVFVYLSERGIGRELAMFYQAYAVVLESQDNFALADKVYMEGLRAQAAPLDSLITAYSGFKTRLQERAQPQAFQAAPSFKRKQGKPFQPLNKKLKFVQRESNVRGAYHPDITCFNGTEETSFEEYRAALMASRAPVVPEPELLDESEVVVPEDHATPVPPPKARGGITPSPAPMMRQNSLPPKSPAFTGGIQGFLGGASPAPGGQDDSVEYEAVPKSGANAPPTPTICTKKAMADVYAMFSDSPAGGDSPMGAMTPFSGASLTKELQGEFLRAGISSPVAFTVYQEDDEEDQENQSPVPAMQVYEDEEEEDQDENAPPAASPQQFERSGGVLSAMTPILETSRESASSARSPLASLEEAEASMPVDGTTDPFASATRAAWAGKVGVMGLEGVSDCSEEAATFDLEAIVSGEEADLELGDMFLHVDGDAPKDPLPGGERLVVQDLDQEDDAGNMNLKVKSAGDKTALWELYIADKLRGSLPEDSLRHFHLAKCAFVYSDRVAVLAERQDHGTLDSVVKAYAKQESNMDGTLAVYYAAEMFLVLEALYAGNVIHCNITPAAFAVRGQECDEWGDWTPARSDGWTGQGLALRDMDFAVDRKLYAGQLSGVSPHARKVAPCYDQALAGKSWTRYVDFVGVANVLHTLLVNEPLELQRSASEGWEPTTGFNQSEEGILWVQVFDFLLNPKGSDEQQSQTMAKVRARMEEYLCSQGRSKQVKHLLCKQNIMVYESVEA